MINVNILKDSIYNGKRLTTLEVKYPYYIHAEVMTHRVFSRNFQSFRAIPVSRLIDKIEEEKWYPIFMKNKAGMEAVESIIGKEYEEAKVQWDLAKSSAIYSARTFADLGVHKQISNRILLPFSLMTGIISSTEWDNFFTLRLGSDAQQEIQELAKVIQWKMGLSIPNPIDIGNWHLPLIEEWEEVVLPVDIAKKVSTARCARVSYLSHNGTRDYNEDITLHDRLLLSKHMSPFEHIATPSAIPESNSNFKGWIQYRGEVERG